MIVLYVASLPFWVVALICAGTASFHAATAYAAQNWPAQKDYIITSILWWPASGLAAAAAAGLCMVRL